MTVAGHDLQKLIDTWRHLDDSVHREEARLERLKQDRQEAANAVGKVMAPQDMKPGETVVTWARINTKQERLIAITNRNTHFDVRWRSEATAEEEQDDQG